MSLWFSRAFFGLWKICCRNKEEALWNSCSHGASFLSGAILVLVIARSGARREIPLEIGLNSCFSIPFGTKDGFNAMAVENIYGTLPHASGKDSLDAMLVKEFREESWLMSRIGNCF